MKCFNHPEREVVATCQKCGKGLCRECAEKYTPCMCNTCAAQLEQSRQQQAQNKENERKEKYRAALVDTRSEFLKTTVIGIIVAIIGTWWFAHDGELNSFGDYANTSIVWFFVPFGWKFITYLQSFFPVSLFGTFWFWIIYIWVKVMLSMVVGIPAFIFQLVKSILTQYRINNLK